eukprot:5454075-Amphidinium_carterae.1
MPAQRPDCPHHRHHRHSPRCRHRCPLTGVTSDCTLRLKRSRFSRTAFKDSQLHFRLARNFNRILLPSIDVWMHTFVAIRGRTRRRD